MNLIIACLTGVFSFVIVVSLMLYLIIHYTKLRVSSKVLIVAATLWYGLLVYHLPPSLMGWATNAEIPNRSIVLSVSFEEPVDGSEGSIYLWVITQDNKNADEDPSSQLKYKGVFSYKETNTPRAYRLPYSRELHKQLVQQMKMAGQAGGYVMYGDEEKEGTESRRPGGDADNFKSKYKSKFKVLNPAIVLPPKSN